VARYSSNKKKFRTLLKVYYKYGHTLQSRAVLTSVLLPYFYHMSSVPLIVLFSCELVFDCCLLYGRFLIIFGILLIAVTILGHVHTSKIYVYRNSSNLYILDSVLFTHQ